MKELQNIITGLTMMGENEIASDLILDLNRYINPFVGGRSTFQIVPMPTASTQKKEIPVKDVVFEVNNDNVPAVSSGTRKKQPSTRKIPLSIRTRKDESCQVNDLKVTNQTNESDEEDSIQYSYSDDGSSTSDSAERRQVPFLSRSGAQQTLNPNSQLFVPSIAGRNQNNSTTNTTGIKNKNIRPMSGNRGQGKTAPGPNTTSTQQLDNDVTGGESKQPSINKRDGDK